MKFTGMRKFTSATLLVLTFTGFVFSQVLPSEIQIQCRKLHPDNIPMTSDEKNLSGLEKIWAANILKVISTNGRWVNFSRDINENIEWKAADPALSPESKWILFSANIPGVTNGWDILYCQKSSSGWGNVMLLGDEVNSAAEEIKPRWISKDKFVYQRAGIDTEANMKELIPMATVLKVSFTSVRMYQEVLAQKKEHVPLYLKESIPLSQSKEERVTMKYLPEPGHVYSVQLGKFRHPDWLAIDQFKDLGDIMLYEDEQSFLIVRLGPFESLENANEVMNQIKLRKWFETAFILYED